MQLWEWSQGKDLRGLIHENLFIYPLFNLFIRLCLYLFHKTIWVQYVEVYTCAVEDTKVNTMGTDLKKPKIQSEKRNGT